MGTCKMHNVNPGEWLENILSVIADHPVNRINELLPHIWILKQK
ncbi:transposase domain-containing protein [Chitinophaga sp. CF418]|nr:transposase domain-containing protein [Chitinophaga sp. CF418]